METETETVISVVERMRNVIARDEYFGVCADINAEKLRSLVLMAHNIGQTEFRDIWLIVSERLLKDGEIDEHHATKAMAEHQAERFTERGMMNVLAQADGVSLIVLAGMIEAFDDLENGVDEKNG